MSKHPIRRRWMQLGFHALRLAVRPLPWRAAQAVGRLAGLAAYVVLGRYRQLTWRQLERAFGPALSASTKHRIARRVFMNLGRNMMEWFVLDRLSPQQILRLVDVQGVSHVRRALANGRGAIVISAHFGNWEIMPMVFAALGFEGGVLARPLRHPEYQSYLWTMRERKGVATYLRGSLKDVARILKSNQLIGMMPDQDMESLEGVFVDFFNRPTYTPVGPAALSLMTGAPIIPCFLVRIGSTFRLVVEEEVTVARTGDRARDLIALTQAWSRMVESYIRCYPHHWVWMHRRWKTQPPLAATAAPSTQTPTHTDAWHTPQLAAV